MNGLMLALIVAVLVVLFLLSEGHEPTRYPTTDISGRELLVALPVAVLLLGALVALALVMDLFA